MSIFARVALALCASLAVALSMIVTLNLLKFEESLKRIDVERATIILLSSGHGAAAAYDRGLPLSASAALDKVRQRIREEERGLEDLLLYDHRGIILDASDARLIGTRLPASWSPARTTEEIWTLRAENRLLVGRTLHSSFGLAIGGLIVALSEEAHTTALHGAMKRWPLKAALILLGSCLLALPAARLLSMRLRRLVLTLAGDQPAPKFSRRRND